MSVTTDRIVGDVERMVLGRDAWIFASFRNEGVRFATDDIDLRNQQTVYVPRNSPANVTYSKLKYSKFKILNALF